jgi:thiol-disulfide isomerase/thioredoxin
MPTQPALTQGPGPNFIKIPPQDRSLGAQRQEAPPIASTEMEAPFCNMQGNRIIVDFAMKGLDGGTWDFHRDHRGKLVLLDFWGTWCPHCIQAMPLLKSWQDRYGPAGLEVIGLDYEDQLAPTEQARKVQNTLRLPALNGLNYRILLGDMRTCPIRNKLQVVNYPTLILLDDSGRILYRCEGLDPQLENVIRQQLGIR